MNTYLRFLVLACLIFQIAQSSAALFTDNKSDNDALLWLEGFVQKGNKLEKNFISIVCDSADQKGPPSPLRGFLFDAIQNAWWKTAEEIVTISKEQGIDITSSFYRSQSIVKSRLQKLQNMLGKNEDWAVISPAFQWAQGQRTISLNIKYAHKWDTPATLGCAIHNITYSATDMKLESRCNSTHKKFILNIPTYKELIPEECKLTDSSVGRIVVSLRKAEPGFWSDLYKDHKKAPRNMHTWWAMKDQLSKEDEEIKKEEEKKKKEEEERMKLEKEKLEKEKERNEKKWLKEEDLNATKVETPATNKTETVPLQETNTTATEEPTQAPSFPTPEQEL